MDPAKIEFIELLKTLGWTQAEAARQLCMTSSAVNQIVNPSSPVRPSPVTMRLLKLIVTSHLPEAMSAAPMALREDAAKDPVTAPEHKLLSDLRALPEEERDRVYEIFNSVLSTYGPKPSQKPVKYTSSRSRGRMITSDKPSSRVADVLQKVEEQLPGALDAERGRPGREPSRGAGERGAKKSQPVPGTRGHSSAQPEPRGEAPTSPAGGKAGSHHKK